MIICCFILLLEMTKSIQYNLSNRGFCDIDSSPIYSCRLFWRGTIPLCIPAPSGMSEFQDEYERISTMESSLRICPFAGSCPSSTLVTLYEKSNKHIIQLIFAIIFIIPLIF